MNQHIQNAICCMLRIEPWYAHAALRMVWLPSTSIETMGVRVRRTGDVECLYSPSFVAELSIHEVATVIQHELEHVVRQHCQRVGHRDPLRWNVAADMVVNGSKRSPRIGIPDPHSGKLAIPHADGLIWIPPSWPQEDSVESYYDHLGRKQLLVGSLLDDHSTWEESDVNAGEMQEITAVFAREVTDAAQGNVPASISNAIQALQPPRVPWSEVLRRNLARLRSNHQRTSFARRNRRRDMFGIPGQVRARHVQASVIVDTSGSISHANFEQFFAEIEKLCTVARVSVLQWDCQFQGFLSSYQRGDWRSLKVAGGGGTDMAAPLHWLKENKRLGDCAITLTDGYCNWPESCNVPYLAVLTTRLRGPSYGQTLYLPN